MITKSHISAKYEKNKHTDKHKNLIQIFVKE